MTSLTISAQCMVLMFLRKARPEKVLLGYKTKKIGKDCWNAPGGKVEPGETVKKCGVRETPEETGYCVDPRFVRERGCADFYNEQEDGSFRLVRVILLEARKGYALDEGIVPDGTLVNINWVEKTRLWQFPMMPADQYWVPKFLAPNPRKRYMRVEAWYGPQQKTLLKPVRVWFLARKPRNLY